MSFIEQIGRKAKAASYKMAEAVEAQKNQVLAGIAQGLIAHKTAILEANERDIAKAKNLDLADSLIDRLSLQGNRLEGIAHDLLQLIKLEDPVGEILEEKELENGLKVSRIRTPIGVIGVIYEARPNVTVDVAALAIKTGNCAILRGGKETVETNIALAAVIDEALSRAGLPGDAVQLIASPDRSHVDDLLKMYRYVDMIIPRGGAGLHHYCREHSMIPVITGGIGICHLFVDESADLTRALNVIVNAKVQRPTVCNALDTLLVHANIAEVFIPEAVQQLAKHGVRFKLDPLSWQIALASNKQLDSYCDEAKEGDWDTEWLGLTLGIKVVDGLDAALEHIALHSSGHSDGIITENRSHGEAFVRKVDSAAVYVNASTRFTDGSQLGLGAEVAISTQKLHARGPMGLKELTTYKWIIKGDYHVRP